jgi:lycopene beta-cyclase
VDKTLKNKNDRTWCFWTKEKNNWFDALATKAWDTFIFESVDFKRKFALKPYRYCMIRGIDFYTYCLKELQEDARFELLTAEITALDSQENEALLKTTDNTYVAEYVFNSAFRTLKKKETHINYVQHFMGWVIETAEPAFDDTCPIFMNFNTEQKNDCLFFYTLPYAKNKALIEYTGFSETRISDNEYISALKNYIENELGISSYTITEKEQGEIPMAESEFINPFGKRVINIGTAGGNSKPSTGYTFYFIQKNTEHLIEQLKSKSKNIQSLARNKRFLLYDKILLQVLHERKISGRAVFTTLFQKNPVARLLAFLNEESTLIEDFGILNSAPKKYFIPPAVKKLF